MCTCIPGISKASLYNSLYTFVVLGAITVVNIASFVFDSLHHCHMHFWQTTNLFVMYTDTCIYMYIARNRAIENSSVGNILGECEALWGGLPLCRCYHYSYSLVPMLRTCIDE